MIFLVQVLPISGSCEIDAHNTWPMNEWPPPHQCTIVCGGMQWDMEELVPMSRVYSFQKLDGSELVSRWIRWSRGLCEVLTTSVRKEPRDLFGANVCAYRY